MGILFLIQITKYLRVELVAWDFPQVFENETSIHERALITGTGSLYD